MLPERGIVGWDLGGAHLKLALLDRQGKLLQVAQRATPIWQGLEHLQQAMMELSNLFPLQKCDHYLTMTGELVDLFDDREQGVAELAAFIAQRLPTGRLWLYAGPRGFIAPSMARKAHAEVGSANWYATAAWLAMSQSNGLLVDVGSTTTDLLPFRDGVVCNLGYTDRERLGREEMIYTGVVRTPLMAVVQRVPFAGEWLQLANEHFATIADVYRILCQLPEDADLHPSADGRGKGLRSSMRRLARMIGADLADGTEQDWQALAAFIADRQLDVLSQAAQRQRSRGVLTGAPIIGAGAGSFVAAALAQRLGMPYLAIDSLFGTPADASLSPAVCAPAVAVARLAASGELACAC